MESYNYMTHLIRAVYEDTAYRAEARREYKDTVLRAIFKDEKRLLELYNAMSGKHYTNPDLLEIVTLENAIYLKVKDDIAFLIDFHLYLYEHQSTVNPNLPFRFLQYVTEEFSRMTVSENLYGSKLIQLPTPHFVVFYNGTEPQPEERILKLSDAYKVSESEVELELQVKVLNINAGFNEELKNQCKTLKEYMQFVDRVRQYQRAPMPLNDAMDLAVEECIKEGILEEFLRENQKDAHLWAIYEYDEEKVINGWKEEGYEDGQIATKREDIIELLKELEDISADISESIAKQTDLEILKVWYKAAVKADSIDDWKKRVGIFES